MNEERRVPSKFGIGPRVRKGRERFLLGWDGEVRQWLLDRALAGVPQTAVLAALREHPIRGGEAELVEGLDLVAMELNYLAECLGNLGRADDEDSLPLREQQLAELARGLEGEVRGVIVRILDAEDGQVSMEELLRKTRRRYWDWREAPIPGQGAEEAEAPPEP